MSIAGRPSFLEVKKIELISGWLQVLSVPWLHLDDFTHL